MDPGLDLADGIDPEVDLAAGLDLGHDPMKTAAKMTDHKRHSFLRNLEIHRQPDDPNSDRSELDLLRNQHLSLPKSAVTTMAGQKKSQRYSKMALMSRLCIQ